MFDFIIKSLIAILLYKLVMGLDVSVIVDSFRHAAP